MLNSNIIGGLALSLFGIIVMLISKHIPLKLIQPNEFYIVEDEKSYLSETRQNFSYLGLAYVILGVLGLISKYFFYMVFLIPILTILPRRKIAKKYIKKKYTIK